MDYIQLLQKRIQSLNDNVIEGLIFDEFFNLENEILALQRSQIENHEGFDDRSLERFSGEDSRYAYTTQWYADNNRPYPSLTPKRGGDKYNFVWGGDFMGNFRMKRQNKGLELYSTGTGSGGKKAFFEDYENMFGLNSENTATIESEVLYYVFEKVINKLYL